MSLGLPGGSLGDGAHADAHEVIHEYLNLISAGGVGGVFEVGHTGELTVETGEHHFTFEADATIVAVRHNLGTAPTGSAATFNTVLHLAGGGSANIFDTHNSIAAGTGFKTGLFVPDTTEADAGDHITFNRVSVGSTFGGSGLVTRLYWIYR